MRSAARLNAASRRLGRHQDRVDAVHHPLVVGDCPIRIALGEDRRFDNALGRAVECGIAPGLHLPALILPVKHRERQEHEADGGPCQSGKAPIPMLGAKASEEVRREHREEASGPEREPEKQGRSIIDALPHSLRNYLTARCPACRPQYKLHGSPTHAHTRL